MAEPFTILNQALKPLRNLQAGRPVNEEKALPHALRELLRQHGDYEVIVVDGGSIHRTLAVLADFGFSKLP